MKHYLQTRNNDSYDLFDVFDDFFKPMYFDETKELKTNITENENDYELQLALPGFGKDEIKVSLENGYLTVRASKQKKEENKNRYLRREISESTSRSYYVGSDISQEQIKAKYDNGMLYLNVPKSQPNQPKNDKFIEIE